MYFSGMEIQWLTQQISSICTPEPRFNLSAPKTTVSRNLTGLGLGFLFSFSNQVPSLLIFTLCLYWKYLFFFLKKLFIVYFASVFAEQLATDLWCSNSFSVLSSGKELLWHTPDFSGQAQLLPLQISQSPQAEQQLSFSHFTSGGSSPAASNGLVHIVDKNLCI